MLASPSAVPTTIEGHEPEPGAPVGDEQEDRDHDHRRQEQGEVGALEYCRHVDGEAFGAGEQGRESVGQVGVRRAAELIGAIRLLGDIAQLGEWHHDERDGAVLRDGGGRQSTGARGGGQAISGLPDRRDVVSGQRDQRVILRPAEDEEGGRPVGVGQQLLGRGDPGRFRGVGQADARRGIAFGSRAQREERTGHEKRAHQHDPGCPATGDERAEGAHVRSITSRDELFDS